MLMVKYLRNLYSLKEAAIKAAYYAIVVKGLGEWLCVGLFSRMLRAFSMAFTFAGEQVLRGCFLGGPDCMCKTADLFITWSCLLILYFQYNQFPKGNFSPTYFMMNCYIKAWSLKIVFFAALSKIYFWQSLGHIHLHTVIHIPSPTSTSFLRIKV